MNKKDVAYNHVVAQIARVWCVPTKVEQGRTVIDYHKATFKLDKAISIDVEGDSIQVDTYSTRGAASVRIDTGHDDFDLKVTILIHDNPLLDAIGHHYITNIILKNTLIALGADPADIPRGCAPVRTSAIAVTYTLPADTLAEKLVCCRQVSKTNFEIRIGGTWAGRGYYDTGMLVEEPKISGFIDCDRQERIMNRNYNLWNPQWVELVRRKAIEAYIDVDKAAGSYYEDVSPLFDYTQPHPDWLYELKLTPEPIKFTADVQIATGRATFYAEYKPELKLLDGYYLVDVVDEGARLATVKNNWVMVSSNAVHQRNAIISVSTARDILELALNDIM